MWTGEGLALRSDNSSPEGRRRSLVRPWRRVTGLEVAMSSRSESRVSRTPFAGVGTGTWGPDYGSWPFVRMSLELASKAHAAKRQAVGLNFGGKSALEKRYERDPTIAKVARRQTPPIKTVLSGECRGRALSFVRQKRGCCEGCLQNYERYHIAQQSQMPQEGGSAATDFRLPDIIQHLRNAARPQEATQ